MEKYYGNIATSYILDFRISVHTIIVTSPWFRANTVQDISFPAVGNTSSLMTLMKPGLSKTDRFLTSCRIAETKHDTNILYSALPISRIHSVPNNSRTAAIPHP